MKILKVKHKVLYIFLLALLILISLFSFAKRNAFAKENLLPESEYYPIEFYPLLEKNTYGAEEEIEILFVSDGDDKIVDIKTNTYGFQVVQEPNCLCEFVSVKVKNNGQTDMPIFTISITFETGYRVSRSVYGFVSDTKIYLSGDSYFCAKDVYWAEMLNDGILTQRDYEIYMKEYSGKSVKQNSFTFEKDTSKNTQKNLSSYDTYVTGTLQWEDDWGNCHPLQYIKVKVMDGNQTLGTVYTNAYGVYNFSFQNTTGGRNIYIKMYPESENTVVKTGSGNEYVVESDTYYHVLTGSLTTIDQTIDMDLYVGRAFQVSQAIITSDRFAAIMNGSSIDDVTVRYPHENTNSTGCYYSGGTIYIVGNIGNNNHPVIDGVALQSYASWDVIQHEYFHHVQHELDITENPGGWHTFSTNMYLHYLSHNGGSAHGDCTSAGIITCANPSSGNEKNKAIRITYAEALPSVLGAMAQRYFIDAGILDSNIKTIGDAQYTSYNNASINYNSNSLNPARYGEAVEGVNACILWDIFDNDNNDDNDNVALGYTGFWNVMMYDNAVTLSEFISSFYTLYPQYTEALASNLKLFKLAPIVNNPPYLDITYGMTVSWDPQGGDSQYTNNSFVVICYDSSGNEIFTTAEISSSSYALSSSEWHDVMISQGQYFYIVVKGYHTDGSGVKTGPYISEKKQIYKPTPEVITVNNSVSGNISLLGYYWYKFTAPSNGEYSFYTTGTTNTFGELFPNYFDGIGTSGRLAYDNNSGTDNNFLITYNLSYTQVVYLRVRGYLLATGDYDLYVVLNQHYHSYTVSYESIDDDFHKSYCDCGSYFIEEHNYYHFGNRWKCYDCHHTVVGIPGGEIRSTGNVINVTKKETEQIIFYKKSKDGEERIL